jgi:hypothetical protein
MIGWVASGETNELELSGEVPLPTALRVRSK